ncbi:MAG: hypothetical protein AMJ88_03960 [Anaerolineae bacterium SM23_ 63]|nr:MAG: hypothetical protein AMJ88_03960 [Anaerolineae bacterium SM23_ 63]HEY48127.1 hypothetical protein [Anaerolineae bacterium]
MSDRLDELLAMMPADPYPEDLADRVQARLAQIRRRSRRIRLFLHFLLVVASVVGLWLIIPQVEMFITTLPDLSLATVEEWLRTLVRSPGEAFLNLSGTVITWISELASALNIEIVLVLGILTASALYGVITLLSNGASQEEVMV